MSASSSEEPHVAEAESDSVVSPIAIVWSQKTTPLEAIERALYALADQLTGVTAEAGSDWEVVVHPRSARTNREGLAHRMRQEVNDQTLRLRIAERTDPLRNLVFALAFSRSPESGGEDPAPGNEQES